MGNSHFVNNNHANTVAYGLVPDEFIRNPDVSPEALILFSFRCTFTGLYVLHERTVCSSPLSRWPRLGIASNFTRDVYRRALIELGNDKPVVPRKRMKTKPPGDVRLGVLKRRQVVRPDGTFGRVVESITRPAQGTRACLSPLIRHPRRMP